MEVLITFVIQAAIFWLLFKIFGQSAKDRNAQANRPSIDSVHVSDEDLKDKLKQLFADYDKVNQPLIMALVFWILTWIFGVLSAVLVLVYYLKNGI